MWARNRETGPDPGTDVVWFPLVWRYGGKDSTTVVAPLFFDFKRGESRTTLGLPVFAYWKRNDTKRLIVFNMYYRRGINQEEGSWHCYVVPFADFGRPRKHDLEWNVLMGLFGYRATGTRAQAQAVLAVGGRAAGCAGSRTWPGSGRRPRPPAPNSKSRIYRRERRERRRSNQIDC